VGDGSSRQEKETAVVASKAFAHDAVVQCLPQSLQDPSSLLPTDVARCTVIIVETAIVVKKHSCLHSKFSNTMKVMVVYAEIHAIKNSLTSICSRESCWLSLRANPLVSSSF
jgi:hypothetical protein